MRRDADVPFGPATWPTLEVARARRQSWATRTFMPTVALVVQAVALVLIVLGIALPLIALASVRHATRAAEQRACQSELTAMQARTPYLKRMMKPADPCVALRVVVGR